MFAATELERRAWQPNAGRLRGANSIRTHMVRSSDPTEARGAHERPGCVLGSAFPSPGDDARLGDLAPGA
eukprot:6137453-Alexandrium_andersonii.AAC.1